MDELGYRLPGSDGDDFEMESGEAGVSRALFSQQSSAGHTKLAEDDFDFGSPQPSDALEHSATESGAVAGSQSAGPDGASSQRQIPLRQLHAASDLGLDEGLLQGGSSPLRAGAGDRDESDPSPTQGDREPPTFEAPGTTEGHSAPNSTVSTAPASPQAAATESSPPGDAARGGAG